MRVFTLMFVLSIIGMSVAIAPVADASSPHQQESCVFIVTVNVTAGYRQPVTDPAFQVASIQGGLSYTVLRRAQTHFYVQYTIGGDGVWLDRRSGYVEGNCVDIPVDERPLTDYEDLCFFTTSDPSMLYMDSQLRQAKGLLEANREILVTGRNGNAYFLHLDHAMGGWVAINSGTVQGTCGNLPDHEDETGLRGIALDNARLWSEPDVRTGVVVADVVAGTSLSIEDGPRMGRIRADTEDRGHFYYVQIDGQTTAGWVWSARLLIDIGDPTSDQHATALDNARLWSQPDVTVGSITHSLDVGTVVIIQSDPQLGRIRTDTSDMGYWYLVNVEDTDTSGWIWAERLSADHTPSTTGTRATALDNARLWSRPDVSVGSVVADVAAGTLVIVESGPQLGHIRVDSDDLGHWYFVRVEGTDTTGWIWSPRLRFH